MEIRSSRLFIPDAIMRRKSALLTDALSRIAEYAANWLTR